MNDYRLYMYDGYAGLKKPDHRFRHKHTTLASATATAIRCLDKLRRVSQMVIVQYHSEGKFHSEIVDIINRG